MPETHPAPPPTAADVAVVAAGPPGPPGLASRLAAEVVVAELRLRRPDLRIEARAAPAGAALDFDGEPAGTLGSVACALVCAGPADRAAGELIDAYGDRGAATEVVALGAPGPDPLALAGRLVTPEQRDRHLDLLRLAHTLPSDRPYLVSVLRDPPAGCDVAVDSFAFRLGGVAYVPAGRITPIDLLAAVSGAAVVVSDDPQMLTLATAAGRPALAVDPDRLALLGHPPISPARAVRHPDDLLARTGAPPPPSDEERHAAETAADRLLDGIAGRLGPTTGRPADAEMVAVLQERVRLLEATNAALRARLYVAARPPRRADRAAGEPAADAELAALRQALAAADGDLRRLQDELERLYATKTMKLVSPARQVYGRLRARRG